MNSLAMSAIRGSRRATCSSNWPQSVQCSQRKTTNKGLPLRADAFQAEGRSVSQCEAGADGSGLPPACPADRKMHTLSSHRRVIIQEGFALSHQYDVGLRGKVIAILLQRHQNLPDNFPRREIADQPQLRGQTEVAIHGAARLGRNANRLAAFLGHEDGFNLRGLRVFATD